MSQETHQPEDKPGWGYQGDVGPDQWDKLDPAFAPCAGGRSQSPIDISSPIVTTNAGSLSCHYRPGRLNISHTGRAIQVNYDPGSYITVDGVRYDLLQFHFHAPGEHSLNGRQFPIEMHLVHSDAGGNLAVVGVMLAEGAENKAFDPVWDNLPAEGQQSLPGIQINAADLLPTSLSAYRYTGSLTTPPCTEGVAWLVLTTPVELSARQIETFETVCLGNSRPVQPRHNRPILADALPDSHD